MKSMDPLLYVESFDYIIVYVCLFVTLHVRTWVFCSRVGWLPLIIFYHVRIFVNQIEHYVITSRKR